MLLNQATPNRNYPNIFKNKEKNIALSSGGVSDSTHPPIYANIMYTILISCYVPSATKYIVEKNDKEVISTFFAGCLSTIILTLHYCYSIYLFTIKVYNIIIYKEF